MVLTRIALFLLVSASLSAQIVNPPGGGSGITANPLTGAATGGAAPGAAFTGAAAVTFDYHTVGAQPLFGTKTANFVYAGPITGTAATPTFRALVNADIPTTLTGITIDGITPTVAAYLDPTSSVQTQLNGKQASGTYVTPTTLDNGTLPVNATTVTIGAGSSITSSGPGGALASGAFAAAYSLTEPKVSAVLKCPDASTSATAYHCTTSPTFVPAAGDMIVLISVNQTNSGAATLTVNGQAGTPSITKRQNAVGLDAGDLMAASAVLLTFDGVYWELQGAGQTIPPVDSPVFTTKITTPLVVGPAIHSTGLCTVVGVEIAQDGYISRCNGITWAIIASPGA